MTTEIAGNNEAVHGVIITDCADANATARQQVRFNRLFGASPAFIGLGDGDNADLEAAGHLVDVLDADQVPISVSAGKTIVLVNVAPRGDEVRKKWENGTPFCHFEVGDATVLSTYEGRALSLVQKLGLVSTVSLFDIPEVTQSLVDDGFLTSQQAHKINNTQFRSLEFLPLAARLLTAGIKLPCSKAAIQPYTSAEGRVWFTDNFGNVKTTLLPGDIDFVEGQTVELYGGRKITCHQRLTDVPSDKLGLTIGSSGYGEYRWLEIAKQGGRVDELWCGKIGSKVLEVC